jgi:hypothetical protein
MDDKQFDGLIRAFGQGTSRRGALGLLAAAAGLGLREVSAKAKHHKGKGNSKRQAQEKQVEICHCPPGNPTNCHTLTIGEKAAQQHLHQHPDDRRGPCPGQTTTTTTTTPPTTTTTTTAPPTTTTTTTAPPSVCSGKTSPNPCFPGDADTCGSSGTGRTCHCGTDLDGNRACYDLAYCLNPRSETLCESNADCEAKGFGQGSVCFSAENCCTPDGTGKARGCTAPCAFPAA